MIVRLVLLISVFLTSAYASEYSSKVQDTSQKSTNYPNKPVGQAYPIKQKATGIKGKDPVPSPMPSDNLSASSKPFIPSGIGMPTSSPAKREKSLLLPTPPMTSVSNSTHPIFQNEMKIPTIQDYPEYRDFSLKDIRDVYLEELQLLFQLKEQGRIDQSKYPFYALSQKISNDYNDWIARKVIEFKKTQPLAKKLGLFVMGSLSTRQAGFCSDLEFGILTEDYLPETIKAAKDLVQFLYDAIAAEGLGDKNLKFDEADLVPIHQKDSGQAAGSRFLIATPEMMALYPQATLWRFPAYNTQVIRDINLYLNYIKSTLDITSIDPSTAAYYEPIPEDLLPQQIKIINLDIVNIAKAMKNIRFIYGNLNLIGRFQYARMHVFQKIFSIDYKDSGESSYSATLFQFYISDVDHNFEKFLQRSDYIKHGIKIAPILNIKKDLYRPIEQFLLNVSMRLGFYYALPNYSSMRCYETDLFKIIDRLFYIKKLNASQTIIIKEYLDFVNYLRLKEHYYLEGEIQDICLNQDSCMVDIKALDAQIRSLEESIEILKSKNGEGMIGTLQKVKQDLDAAKLQKTRKERAMGKVTSSSSNVGGSTSEVLLLTEADKELLQGKFKDILSILREITQ